ncbi:MAG: bifunctional riboflavin kinase/FAD synthetase [Thermoguttaceae bacterium]|nr:bifunctional riboflavin kinase/FAD synthetase [Thermoguttaceae bacterium]
MTRPASGDVLDFRPAPQHRTIPTAVHLIRDLEALPAELRGGAISIGNFDGVHRGHARLAERLVTLARAIGGPAIAFTFDPHPAKLLRPEAAPTPLCWVERKAEMLAALGVDAVVAYPTGHELLALSAPEFFTRIVQEGLAAGAIVEGHDFHFGRGRSGDTSLLRELCAAAGMQVDVVEPVMIDGEPVSSSRVRQLVASGDVGAANRLLTRPYRIRGVVGRGAARGTALGYPTANLQHIDTLLPREGIYAGLAHVEGESRPTALSVGPNPTFGESALKIEAFLLDFDGDLYGMPVQVDFLARLRDIVRFAAPAELVAQMEQDVLATRRVVEPVCGQG